MAAFLLALYWVVAIERKPEQKPRAREIWDRFPKFVLGFVLASLLVTLGLFGASQVKAITGFCNWFLTLAFVSIGLQLSWQGIKQMGAKPILAYLVATLFNTFLALGLAWAIFR